MRYTLDEHVLDIETPLKYYLVGLFFATGCADKNRGNKFVEIARPKGDDILLRDIQTVLKTDKPVHSNEDGSLQLNCFSDVLYDGLREYGVREYGSPDMSILKQIPNNFHGSFLRGCFDGAGEIVSINKVATIILCKAMSDKFAGQVRDMVQALVPAYPCACIPKVGNKTEASVYCVEQAGRGGLQTLATLYASEGLFVPQKYVSFLEHVRLTADEMMMELAYACAARSTCVRRKVGCVLSDSERIRVFSVGYNGGVRGGNNYCESALPGRCGCVHAEVNALIKAETEDGILYCTTLPCDRCAKLIVNARISKVYYGSSYRYTKGVEILNGAGIGLQKLSRAGVDGYGWKLDICRIINSAQED